MSADANKQKHLLRIRDLIASKEFEIAKANYELHHFGNWQSDHNSAVASLDLAIQHETEALNYYG